MPDGIVMVWMWAVGFVATWLVAHFLFGRAPSVGSALFCAAWPLTIPVGVAVFILARRAPEHDARFD